MARLGEFHGSPPDPVDLPPWAAGCEALRALDDELDEPAGIERARPWRPRQRWRWASSWPARTR